MKREIKKEDYKRIPFEILLYVADFCDKNSIRYSLAYGTLLGAIRHKGFIPWDDDIDIIMPRKDYERFKRLYYSDRYPFSDITVNVNHPTGMAKIYDSRTYFYYNNIKRSYGLFVDVFTVDNFPLDVKEQIEWQKKIKKLIMINTIKNTSWKSLLFVPNMHKGIKILIKLIPIPLKFIQSRIVKLSMKYDNDNTGRVGITMSVDNPEDTYPSDLFEEYIEVEFEGHVFKAIRQYNKWLTICYGDYMQLPPKDKRVGKHNIVAYYK